MKPFELFIGLSMVMIGGWGVYSGELTNRGVAIDEWVAPFLIIAGVGILAYSWFMRRKR